MSYGQPPGGQGQWPPSQQGGKPPQYGQPGQYQQGQQYPQGPVKSYLVESILSLLFCGGVLAIPAIVFACQVDSKLKSGDYNGAVQASKSAKTWLMVAVGVASGIIVLSLMFVVCMGILGAAAQA